MTRINLPSNSKRHACLCDRLGLSLPVFYYNGNHEYYEKGWLLAILVSFAHSLRRRSYRWDSSVF